jgi:hypothetical protein
MGTSTTALEASVKSADFDGSVLEFSKEALKDCARLVWEFMDTDPAKLTSCEADDRPMPLTATQQLNSAKTPAPSHEYLSESIELPDIKSPTAKISQLSNFK